ncbi:hypothetical protein Pint_14976 [Pistacia integerrima]|uniref:Uncharacterized protein n=1 Tax=Pistacia integerrima TaxID=434235 RepID=A0ACC0ZGA8_9ROSI|nr:hypothetical protein Pint_14976 [Pistacia integerrima]
MYQDIIMCLNAYPSCLLDIPIMKEKGNGMLEMSLIDDKADFRGAKISKLEVDMVP